MSLKSLIVVVLFLLIPSFAQGTKLTILHMNDTHGHLEGYAAISGLVNKIRKEVKEHGGEVLFVHAGDFNTGTPESDLLDAEPDIDIFNQMGVDVAALGNHEFDNDFSVLRKQIKQAKFSIIVANVKPKSPKYFSLKPSLVKKVGDQNVYIIGITTNNLKNIVTKNKRELITVQNPVAVVKNYVSKLPVDSFILVLSHMGASGGKHSGLNDINDEELAEKVSGIDLIVGGHSHTYIEKPIKVNGALIVQAGEYARGLGRLDLEIEEGKIVDYKYKLIYTKGKEEDPKIKEVVKNYLEKGGKKLNVVIGINKSFLDNLKSTDEETAIGDLAADAMRAGGNCDIAIQGGAGIRGNLEEGDVKVRDILIIHPFGNKIVKIKLTGKELDSILDEVATTGKFVQVSGMNIHIKGNNVKIDKIEGKVFDPKKHYLLCSDNYLAYGGDGLTKLRDIKSKELTNIYVHDGLIDYIKKNGRINYNTEKRIIIEK